MKNYWSCSKFADWLRGTSKPYSETSEGWGEWEKQAKKKGFRYWLAEEGLDYLQNIIYSPLTLINAIRCYISNRWVVKTHALTSNLKPGQWYDLDVRLIECIFDELVNFVETDLALESRWVLSDEACKKYKTPWYHRFFRLGDWRCSAAGIAHLHWASELKHDEEWIDKNDPKFGQPTPQALAAKEILVLYQWWKVDRPNRSDPGDTSGWNEYCDEKENAAKARGEDPLQDMFSNNRTDDERKHANALSDIRRKMEQAQEDEDTAMLIRVIKVRRHLWT